MGDDSSTRRPKGPKMRSMSARTCSSLSKLTLARDRRPSRSMYTLSVPLTMISVTVSSAIRSSSGPSPNTVLIRPSTKSRNTAGASAFHGSRVESLRQAARDLVARPLRAVDGDERDPIQGNQLAHGHPQGLEPRCHALIVLLLAGVFRHANPFQKRHFLTSLRCVLGQGGLATARATLAFSLLAPQPRVCLGRQADAGERSPAPPHLQDEKPRAAARREHPQCLCTKGSKPLPGSAPCPRRAAPPLRDRRRPAPLHGPHPTHWDTSMDVKGA